MSGYDPPQYGQPYGQQPYGQPPYGQQPYAQQQGYGYAYGAPPPPFQYAGFWIRWLASFIDGLVTSVPIAVLAFVTAPIGDDAFRIGYGITPGAQLWINGLSLAVGFLYNGLLIGGTSGQTLGQRACRIRVVDQDTGLAPIGVGRAMGRHAMSLISSIPCALGYLWMLWDPRKQTWHDKVVRSIVIRA